MGVLSNIADSTGISALNLGTVANVLLWLFIIAIVGFAVGIGTYLIIKWLKYKKKIVIFERIGSKFEPTRKDKGRLIHISNSGDEVLHIRKHDKYLPRPQIQTGKNTYWYFISDDGEWINFGPGDFDEDRKEMGAHMLDKEMRYARISLDKMRQDRYEKTGFWEKYGGMIAYAALILVTGIVMFLILREFSQITGSANQAIEASKEVMETAKQILGSVENVKSGGPGYVVNSS